ncbi:hypothetical protein N7504_010650 [Penicillium tannophilum]|nr:hypothetical protein N7504_010650 [Penicillium tannophilum]
MDDSLSFNTQSTSQWDGLRHFAFRKSCQYYNGYTSEDFESSNVLGTQAWIENGGIAGRGILVDFCAWAESQGEKVDVHSGRAITLAEVNEILKYQNTTIRPGDILVFRTGWLKWYNETEATARHHELCVRKVDRFIGLSQQPNFVEWLWNNQIAAVAGDQLAFECTPPPEDGFGWLHEHLLAGLGCPIGELFDTEKIAKSCAAEKRYEFFLSSAPLHLEGGVASPANTTAFM